MLDIGSLSVSEDWPAQAADFPTGDAATGTATAREVGLGKTTLNLLAAPFKALGGVSRSTSGGSLGPLAAEAGVEEEDVRAWTAEDMAAAVAQARVEIEARRAAEDSIISRRVTAVDRAAWALFLLAAHAAVLVLLTGGDRARGTAWALACVAPLALATAAARDALEDLSSEAFAKRRRRSDALFSWWSSSYVAQREEAVFPTLAMLDLERGAGRRRKKRAGMRTAAVAGSTTRRATWPGEAGTWEPTEAALFRLRGPDYLRDKKKFPSAEALYEPFAVDIIRSRVPLFDVAGRVQLPEKRSHEVDLPAWLPRVLVTNMHFPGVPPPLFVGATTLAPAASETSDAPPGWHVVCYWRVTEATVAVVRTTARDSWPAHLKLWRHYATRAATSPVLNGCLKGVAQVENIDEPGLGLPRLVRQYNGKPVLMAASALVGERPGVVAIEQDDDYIEFDLNVGEDFAAVSNHAVFALKDKFPRLVADIGWLVEGRSLGELPESLLAGLRLNRVDFNAAVDVETFLAGEATPPPPPVLPNAPPSASSSPVTSPSAAAPSLRPLPRAAPPRRPFSVAASSDDAPPSS